MFPLSPLRNPSPDADRTTTMNRELTLQVQDFKAGFEFLARRIQEGQGVATCLATAQARVVELERELASQVALKEALAKELHELKATHYGFLAELSRAQTVEDSRMAEMQVWVEATAAENKHLRSLLETA